MADHLDVSPEVLQGIAGAFDDRSREVDELTLPGTVDGGIASGDIIVLIADLSLDLADIAGGMGAMSHQLVETRKHYINQDEDAAEALFMVGGAG